MLLRGFDDVFPVPQSRHTTVRREDVEKVPALKILASSEEAGVYAVSTKNGKQFFITGHSEYDRDTLEREYLRDKEKGEKIAPPKNYYVNGTDGKINVSWRSTGTLLFSNWLNYYVYQVTPYDNK